MTYDEDAKQGGSHVDIAFSINSHDTDTSQTGSTTSDLAKRNALERMMMQRQSIKLEETKVQAFGRVTLVLFLLYNVLTSNVFGLFACFDMDYGDRFNRFDLEVDCNDIFFKNGWQAVALFCLLLYPLGIPLIFGLMIFLNRKVLSQDPSEQMSLEDFANVVNMLDEDATAVHEYV